MSDPATVTGEESKPQASQLSASKQNNFGNYSGSDQDQPPMNPNESYLRSKIQDAESYAYGSKAETYDIQDDTNDHLNRLKELKKNRSQMEREFDSLNNKITGLKKLQKKKYQSVRVLNKKIHTLEERFHDQEEMKREREAQEKELHELRNQKALHKKGYISTDLIRLKRKLDHEIIMDGIRNVRRKRFLQTKQEQEEQKNAIDMRREEIKETNKQRMLAVQFGTKMASLRMQRYKEDISIKTNERVKKERWEQARLAKIAQASVEKLKKKSEAEEELYQESMMEEVEKKSKYESMLEASYLEHKAKIDAINQQSKLAKQQRLKQNQSQTTLNENKSKESLADNPEMTQSEIIGEDPKSKTLAKKKGRQYKSTTKLGKHGNFAHLTLRNQKGSKGLRFTGKHSEQTAHKIRVEPIQEVEAKSWTGGTSSDERKAASNPDLGGAEQEEERRGKPEAEGSCRKASGAGEDCVGEDGGGQEEAG